MARMRGMMETLVQHQSQPPLFTDREQADMLWLRLRVEQKKAAVEVAIESTTEADSEEDCSRVRCRDPKPQDYGSMRARSPHQRCAAIGGPWSRNGRRRS